MKKVRIYSSALKGSMNMLIEKGANLRIGDQIEGKFVQHIDYLGTYDAVYFNGFLKRDFSMGEDVPVQAMPDSISIINPINHGEEVKSRLRLMAEIEKANAKAEKERNILFNVNERLSRLNRF